EKSVVNNKGKGTGQREVRPVWNNARRVNHQNFSKMTHPHQKRNFVPTKVATKSGHVLVNAAKQSSAASTSTAKPKVNTAAIRPNVNTKSSYFKPHFPKRSHFNQRSATKTNTFSRKINTAKGKNVTTIGPKAVVNAAEGKKENIVKSSACWIWRPKGKLATAKVKKVNDQEQIQALVDKKKAIFEGLARMRYEKPSQKLTYKAYFSSQWKFLIHAILQYLSAKTTAWNEFSSIMEFAIICLADNQKFNFSKRIGAGFSGVITPLFDTMMVQAPAEMGDTLVENHQTPIVDQPSTFKPQKKQKPRWKQRKEADVSNDEPEDEDHVPTPSSDPLPSGDDSFILNELLVFCTSLQEQVLDLQEAKDAQAKEIAALKKKGRTNDDEMFRVDDLDGEEVVMDTTTVTTTTVKDSAAPTIDVTEYEITMAQALAALKSIKLKVVVQEQEMSTTIPAATITVTTAVPTPRAKGKAKMIEPEVPIKKKDQTRIDEEYARKLEAEEQEAARLNRAQKDKGANNSWDNIQAMMDSNRLLAKRLQAREREEFSKVQKARLTAEHLESDISKKQKVDENVKPVIDDNKELKKCMEIVPDDGDEVLIEATPLSSRSPTIIDYKIHKEGKKTYFKIIRANGNSQVYQTFEKMFKNFNREDLEIPWAIVKDKFKKEKLVDDMDNLLFRTLKTMFEHHVEDNI
nr:hypothetical protein [Tanacetum cinerariifolium]